MTGRPKNVHVASSTAPACERGSHPVGALLDRLPLRPHRHGQPADEPDDDELADDRLHQPRPTSTTTTADHDREQRHVADRVELEAEHGTTVGHRPAAVAYPPGMSDQRPIEMSSGLPSTVLPDAEPAAREALAEALAADADRRRDAIARVVARYPRFLEAWAALGDAGRDDDRALRRLPRRLPPRAGRPSRQRLARLRLRPLGRAVEPWVPPVARRARRDGGGDRGARRGRALCPVPGPTGPGHGRSRGRRDDAGAVLCGRPQPPDGDRQGAGRGRRRGDGGAGRRGARRRRLRPGRVRRRRPLAGRASADRSWPTDGRGRGRSEGSSPRSPTRPAPTSSPRRATCRLSTARPSGR